MRVTRVMAIVLLCAAVAAASIPARAAAPAGPPLSPGSIGDALDPSAAATTLAGALAAVQTVMDQLWRWLDLLRQTAAGDATQIVVPLPTSVPAGAGPLDTVAALAALPAQWRALIAAARAKLGLPDTAGATAAQHKTDITGSPELTHEAATITAADQQVASGALQQEVAVAATAAVADAAARDTTLDAAAAAARAAGDELAGEAQNLPSSRAGIELLVAGAGTALRQQADLTAALASRVNGLIQQGAQLSGQLGALAATLGVFTARDAERERRALDAQLGVADAANSGGTLLQQLLSGAGDPADEIRLDPLY
jgi:hypothetical protein